MRVQLSLSIPADWRVSVFPYTALYTEYVKPEQSVPLFDVPPYLYGTPIHEAHSAYSFVLSPDDGVSPSFLQFAL